MKPIEGIFSVRIVVADYYMQRPKNDLDLCYSKFRSSDIKSVPVIRVFGSNSEGYKTCMHVHGVFPYLYIPHESKDLGAVETFKYKLAASLDKAINITLGQGSSKTQHVFKVELVQAIPFYGYHKNEHQYLKIFLYQPRFIKRAANLLQNGAIMNKHFQPLESHVPYILQFLIDYNLYGMSYMHLPKEIMKFRRDDNGELFYDVNPSQILSNNIEKLSICKLECDVNAAYILNRFQLSTQQQQQTEHKNPGIKSIWQDEKIRRKILSDKNEIEIPSLELPKSDIRLNVQTTDSDIFYRNGLQNKLLQYDEKIDQTINSTVANTSMSTSQSLQQDNTKKKFNLNKILANSIYPEECLKNSQYLNASIIHDHMNVLNESKLQILDRPIDNIIMSNDSDCTLLNESVVLSLTQKSNKNLNTTLPDYEVLEVLRQLEEGTTNEMNSPTSNDQSILKYDDDEVLEVLHQLENGMDDDKTVDLDSTLAPLSQIAKSISQTKENKFQIQNSDDEDELNDANDFSMINEDFDELFQLEKTDFDNHNGFAQLDGGDDKYTPTKKQLENLKLSHQSPRTPRSCRNRLVNRYAPLNVIIKSPSVQNKPNKKLFIDSDCEIISHSSDDETETIQNLKFLRKKKRESLQNEFNEIEPIKCSRKLVNSITPQKSSSQYSRLNNIKNVRNSPKSGLTNGRVKELADLDKTETVITCRLRPPKKEENILKTIKLRDNTSPNYKRKCKVKLKKCDNFIYETLNESVTDIDLDSPEAKKFKLIHESNGIGKVFNKTTNTQNLSQNLSPIATTTKKCRIVLKKCNLHESVRKKISRPWSPSDVAREYDRRNNFFPEPGPSHINYYELIKLPSTPKSSATPKTNELSNQKTSNKDEFLEKSQSPCIDSEPILMQSFYSDATFLHSPALFEDADSPTPSLKLSLSIPLEGNNFLNNNRIATLNPLIKRTNLIRITPQTLPPNPKEVLQTLSTFQIPLVKYTQPFYSNSSDVTNTKEIGNIILRIPGNSLNDCQEFSSLHQNLITLNLHRKIMLENLFESSNLKTSNQIKEYFCTERKCIIISHRLPPTKHDAKIWFKARNILKKLKQNIQDDSPIQIRRQKIVMIMDNNDTSSNTINCSANNSEDDNMPSLKLSPITPYDEYLTITDTQIQSNAITPLSSSLHRKSSLKCRISLTEKFRQINQKVQNEIESIPISNSIKKNLSSESFVATQNSNSSICTEVALAALEKSSFQRNMNSCSNDDLDKSFGISGATLNNTFGFKVDLENLQNAKADIEHNYLTTLSVEVFVPTRNDLKPNPEYDPIMCLFYSIVNNVPDYHECPTKSSGFIIVESIDSLQQKFSGLEEKKISVETELDLLDEISKLCQIWDPDILSGYEIELGSWGYIIDRSKYLGIDMASILSRVPSQKTREPLEEDREQYTDLDFELKLCGRILLNVWRLMRSEIALTSYTFENCMYHILHRRVPLHSYRHLTEWFSKQNLRWIVIEYYMERVNGTLELLEQLDLIGRTSEMAKLIGIQFYEVLSRGSQYRVESMMLRIAKPKNIVPLSPSVEQRAHMRSPEYLPLILEPQSRFYTDPIIVLDFQSLYPSMIIAYNYCFSTCLGRVEHLAESTTPFEFGASQLRVPPQLLKKLLKENQITISPCGVVFVKSEIREGILPTMLSEILNTRIMVKQSMKLHKGNSTLQRVLHSRQLGLKLMANVTYGYTAANFSGRMPCVEVGDSVVAKGRETLERAIKMIEANEKWQAKVVYGDTDSVFVLCAGRSRTDAFKIGEEIAEVITNDNPPPVKLKLEKIYQPCILQTKKRYVGYMYETADQKDPIYEAKGIETVRRDGCPAVGKILEKTLRILFETKDISKIKEYVCRQFTKLLQGKANLQDLIYAKEFRGLNGYKPTACVPALEMTRKFLKNDPRNIPRTGERVPYVISHGPPGVPLIRLVRSPHDFLADSALKINSTYYITKAIIPPLNRCLLLLGVDVNNWFSDLPRKTLAMPFNGEVNNTNKIMKRSTISQYFTTTNCIINCGRKTSTGICSNCIQDATKCVVTLQHKISNLERGYYVLQTLCQACCKRLENIECSSLDCPVLYILENKKREQPISHSYKELLANQF